MKRFYLLLLVLGACSTTKNPAELYGKITPVDPQEAPKIGANLSGDIDAATAEATTKEWLASLPGGVFKMSIAENPGVGMAPYCLFNASLTCDAERADILFIYSTKTRNVSLGFNKKITPRTTTKEAQEALSYISLDLIPPDSLVIPGWEIRPSTSISSFKEGVEIASLTDKKITVHVKTNLSSIYGRKMSCGIVMDAPMPEGCYFSVNQNIPLELTLDLPMFQGRSQL